MSSIPKPRVLKVEPWVLTVRGDSMRFLLKAGDRILVRRARIEEMRAGDMVVLLDWRSRTPEYVVHRLLARWRRRGEAHALTKGDSNLLPDRPVPASRLVGVVAGIGAGGRWLSVGAGSRRRGLALGGLAAPAYRGANFVHRLGEAALRFLWARVFSALRVWGPRRVLHGMLAANERAAAVFLDGLQKLCCEWIAEGAIVPPISAESTSVVLGILDAVQVWSGKIRLEGDVFVPPGSTLRILPGTDISFRADSQWDYTSESRLWKDWSGGPREKGCRIFVAGRLVAEGTPQAPIRIGGSAWGGIHFFADSWGSILRHAELDGCADAAVGVWDSSHAALSSVSISGCGIGLLLGGRGAAASLDECAARRCRRYGVSTRGGALQMRRSSVEDCGEIGVLAEGGADVRMQDCRLSGGRSGFGLKDGRAELVRVCVEGAADAGLELDGERQSLREVVVSNCAQGLRFGGDRLDLEDLRLVDCGLGLAQRSGTVRWRGGAVEGGRGGFETRGLQAELEDVSFRGLSGHAVAVESARLTARNLRMGGCAGGAVYARAARGLDIDVAEIEDCAFGLSLEGERAELKSVVVRRCGLGAELRSGRLFWKGGGIFDGGLLVDSGAAAELEAVELRGRGVEVRGGEFAAGRCRWKKIVGVGVRLDGGRAELNEAEFNDIGGHGIEVRGGELAAWRCRWDGVDGVGVRLKGGAHARLQNCVLRRTRFGLGAAGGRATLADVRIVEASQAGVSLESGRHRLENVSYYSCGDDLYAAPGVEIEVVTTSWSERLAERLKRAALPLVLRTRRLPFFALGYRLIYALPVRLLQGGAWLDRDVVFLGAHRSWARGDWEPGSSDVDLLLCARDLEGEAGARRLVHFWRRLLLLKRFFPFLGECLVVEEEDLRMHRRWGGWRARDFESQLVVLSGRLPAGCERADSPKKTLEPFGEAAHAYTRLMSWALWRATPRELSGMHASKAALDLLRLSSVRGGGGPLSMPARAMILQAAGAAAADFREPLKNLGLGETPASRARAELCAASLGLLHGWAKELSAARPDRANASSLKTVRLESEARADVEPERGRRGRLRDELRRALGPALVAACCDDLYRSVLVVDDAASSREQLTDFFTRLAGMIQKRAGPATLPLVMTESVWKVWSRLAYLESPLLWLESGEGGGEDFLRRAGEGVPGAWQYGWGMGKLRPLHVPDDLVLGMGRESLATLRCQWRFQAAEVSGLSRAYVLHYLLSRTMGLRLLLERGIATPFFGLDPLRVLYAREFPDEAGALRELWGCVSKLDTAARWTDLYGWVDSSLRRSVF